MEKEECLGLHRRNKLGSPRGPLASWRPGGRIFEEPSKWGLI